MNDDDPTPDDAIDLAASAALDGEPADASLTSEDRQRVAAHVEELRPAIDALGQPVDPPRDEVRAEQIAAAIAAGRPASAVDDESGPGPVRLADRAVRRRARNRTLAVAAAAAAAVVVLVIAISALSHSGSNRTDSATQAVRGSAAEHSTSSSPAPGVAGTIRGTDGAERKAGPSPSLPDLGAAANAADLATLVTRARSFATNTQPAGLPSNASSSAFAPAAQSAGCDASVRAQRPGLGALVYDARATLSGADVEVLVYTVTQPAGVHDQLVAAQPPTCRITVDRPL